MVCPMKKLLSIIVLGSFLTGCVAVGNQTLEGAKQKFYEVTARSTINGFSNNPVYKYHTAISYERLYDAKLKALEKCLKENRDVEFPFCAIVYKPDKYKPKIGYILNKKTKQEKKEVEHSLDKKTLDKLLNAAKDFREKRITESEFDQIKDDILKTL